MPTNQPTPQKAFEYHITQAVEYLDALDTKDDWTDQETVALGQAHATVALGFMLFDLTKAFRAWMEVVNNTLEKTRP